MPVPVYAQFRARDVLASSDGKNTTAFAISSGRLWT
jgi:hypothetical protein